MRHVLTCVLVTLFASTSLADEKSDAWKMLDRRVGNWTGSVTVKPSGDVLKGKESCKWILDGRFLEIRSVSDDGHKSLTLVKQDGKDGYLMWHYDKHGNVSNWKGKAGDHGEKIEFTGVFQDGNTATATWEYPAANTVVWKATLKNASGKTLADFVGELRRDKK